MNFIDEQIEILNQKHSNNPYVAPQVLNSITDNTNGISDFNTWIQAAGIGAGNMLNNTIFGGLGQILGSIGAGVEYVSPFSGSQADERINLLRLGIPYETAKEIYPDQDSWITSLAKGSLGVQNSINDAINSYRSNIIGDNPDYGTQVAEGTGSSLGFMGAGMGASYLAGLAGLGPLGIILAGALAAGGLEALSESGGTLGEAYRLGKYDEGGLAAANKSFLTNAALNFTLDSGLGFFAPWTAGIRNPITKFAARTAGSVLNELIQEPSQQVIEKSAVESLNNGGNFMTALGHEFPHWWETAKQLAPSVAGSSLLTSLITGGAGLANPNIRRTVASQFAHRNEEDTSQAKKDIQAHYDAIARLRRRIEREQTTGNNQAVIDSLNHRIEKRIRQIQRLTDTFSLYNFTPAPSNRFDGNISQVVTRDGNPAVNTQFMLIDASDLITSHNDDFTPNPNFNQTQPRFRGREEAQNEVAKMAATLDPNSLGENYHAQSGAPIVALVDGKYQTISGNGRVMATRRAYSQHPEKAQNYRQFIIDNASRFGVDPDLARKLKNPVLVRRIVDENIDLAKFANEANESNIQALSTAENATKDAQNLTDDIISKYDPDKDIPHNSDFLKAFRGIIPENERNAFFDTNGNLSKNGEIRVQNALLAYAYSNREIISKLSEQNNDVSKNVSHALVQAAPDFVKLKKGNVRQDLILDEDIAQAVLQLDQFRNNNKKVSEQIQQPNLRGNDGTDINDTLDDQNSTTRAKLSEEAQLLLQFFHEFRDKPNAILRGLRRYALVASSQPEQGQ
ncbi:MAG: hypothetical protein IJQ08_08605, partial [Synergistaceae bacterium]|nr:hypothetical protein [Synergistaceae bacterium]